MDRRLGFALLLLTVSLPAAAGQMYRWVDKNGQEHFTDHPVPNSTEIKPRSTNTEQAPTPQAPAPKVDETACATARATHDQYTRSDRIVEKDALGAEREFTPEEREKLLARSLQQAKDACGGNF